MRPYSQDLRERVVRACDQRVGTRGRVAELFGVSVSWVRKLLRRRRDTGSVAALPHNAGRRPKLTEEDRRRLAELVRQDPGATLAELRERLGAPVSLSVVHGALKALGLPLKKSRSRRPSRPGRTSPSAAPAGAPASRNSTRGGSSSSTRAARRRP